MPASPNSKMLRSGSPDLIREKKGAPEYDDRGFDDVERNFQEAGV